MGIPMEKDFFLTVRGSEEARTGLESPPHMKEAAAARLRNGERERCSESKAEGGTEGCPAKF